MTPQWLPRGLWIRGGGRELGLLSLAGGGQAESSPPAVAHKGMEGMDEAKLFLTAATGDATKGSGHRLQPRGFRLDVENPFSPRQVPKKWEVSIWAKPGTVCIVWLGTQGSEVPRNGCLAQHQDTGNDHPSSLGTGDPKCPGLGHRATVPPGSCCRADVPSLSHCAACCKPGGGENPSKINTQRGCFDTPSSSLHVNIFWGAARASRDTVTPRAAGRAGWHSVFSKGVSQYIPVPYPILWQGARALADENTPPDNFGSGEPYCIPEGLGITSGRERWDWPLGQSCWDLWRDDGHPVLLYLRGWPATV